MGSQDQEQEVVRILLLDVQPLLDRLDPAAGGAAGALRKGWKGRIHADRIGYSTAVCDPARAAARQSGSWDAVEGKALGQSHGVDRHLQLRRELLLDPLLLQGAQSRVQLPLVDAQRRAHTALLHDPCILLLLSHHLQHVPSCGQGKVHGLEINLDETPGVRDHRSGTELFDGTDGSPDHCSLSLL